jgi:hypothetical protein
MDLEDMDLEDSLLLLSITSDEFYKMTVPDLTKVYHKLARTMHPDKNKDPDSTAKFQTLSTAYQFLKQTLLEKGDASNASNASDEDYQSYEEREEKNWDRLSEEYLEKQKIRAKILQDEAYKKLKNAKLTIMQILYQKSSDEKEISLYIQNCLKKHTLVSYSDSNHCNQRRLQIEHYLKSEQKKSAIVDDNITSILESIPYQELEQLTKILHDIDIDSNKRNHISIISEIDIEINKIYSHTHYFLDLEMQRTVILRHSTIKCRYGDKCKYKFIGTCRFQH